MKKVIVIVGQTATGKSSLAIKVAKKFGGEIISADSRQVYKELNIGTGKIIQKEMMGIPHHLLNVANPNKKFTVVEYQTLVNKKIKEIIDRGKTPIIVGGTGFYIDAVTQGVIFPEVPPNTKLRKILEKKSLIELFNILNKLDKVRATNIDKNNKVRLVRAIEIAKFLGKVPKIKKIKPKYTFIKVGISLPPLMLIKKIEKRTKKMFKDGLLNEIKKLKKLGVTDKRLKEFGFEYWKPTEERVVLESMKYAKRQMTWFKKDKDIKWFSVSDALSQKRLVVKIWRLLKQ